MRTSPWSDTVSLDNEEKALLASFDEDVTAAVPHGARVEIDPRAKTSRVL